MAISLKVIDNYLKLLHFYNTSFAMTFYILLYQIQIVYNECGYYNWVFPYLLLNLSSLLKTFNKQ